MTIAEKITRAKADYDAVYEGGKAKAFAEVEPINADLEQILYGKDTGGRGFYDEFWDAFQNYGNRVDYNHAFYGLGWDENTFKPKYDFIAGRSYNMFAWSYIKQIDKVVDISKSQQIYGTFAYCYKLHTIKKFAVNENCVFSNDFKDCVELVNLTIEGTIGKNGFDVHWSTKLSKESIKSIINALSATTSGLAITFSKTAVNKAFETAEGANDGSTSAEWNALIAPKSNWTISLV